MTSAVEGETPTPVEGDGERVSYLGFFIGAEIYGVPVGRLREVARLAHLRRMPGAPPGVAGLANLRGEIICAFDIRVPLGLDDLPPPPAPFFLALRGFPDPCGLIVDAIADIYQVAPADIEAAPETWPPERQSCVIGAARVRDGFMGLIDVERVVQS